MWSSVCRWLAADLRDDGARDDVKRFKLVRREPTKTAARKFPYSPYYPTRYRFNVRREKEEVGQRRTRWRIHEYEAVGWPRRVILSRLLLTHRLIISIPSKGYFTWVRVLSETFALPRNCTTLLYLNEISTTDGHTWINLKRGPRGICIDVFDATLHQRYWIRGNWSNAKSDIAKFNSWIECANVKKKKDDKSIIVNR